MSKIERLFNKCHNDCGSNMDYEFRHLKNFSCTSSNLI